MRNSWGRRGFRPNKYNNQTIKYDGFTFSSETEYNRYLLLKDRVHDREITDLRVHPGFWLIVNKVEIFERQYHPDFAYRLAKCPHAGKSYQDGGCIIDPEVFPNKLWAPGKDLSAFEWCDVCCTVEDTKGYMDPGDPATRMFKVQQNLMQAIYGIEVKVVQTILTQRRQERAQANKKEKRRLQQLALKMENDQPNDRRRK